MKIVSRVGSTCPRCAPGVTEDGGLRCGLDQDLAFGDCAFRSDGAAAIEPVREMAARVDAPLRPLRPDDNPKSAFGVLKPSVGAIPCAALLHLGAAMADGERKYGLVNWRENAVSARVYYDAAMRHLMAWWDGEKVDPKSGVDHRAHAMACLSIILDAEECGRLADDRPRPGVTSEMIERMTLSAR